METNLDSNKYVHYPCGARYNQHEGYEAYALVLLLSCCAEESPIVIPLVLFGICRGGVLGCGGVGLWRVGHGSAGQFLIYEF
jgi:hypothetical protein